jgi:N utilization substance protein B
MGVRRKARECALQAQYMFDYCENTSADCLKLFLEHFEVSEAVAEYAVQICDGIKNNLNEIDSEITSASENWSLSRMCKIDRAILRIATFEIIKMKEVPTSVILNEAIEVSKAFGTEESRMFINGVLDKIAERIRGENSKSSSSASKKSAAA